MTQLLKSHWDVCLGVVGLFGTISAAQINVWLALAIGFFTLMFVMFKAFIWALKTRIAWKNRNNTTFFQKLRDDDSDV